jgi:hypothetical protein
MTDTELTRHLTIVSVILAAVALEPAAALVALAYLTGPLARRGEPRPP